MGLKKKVTARASLAFILVCSSVGANTLPHLSDYPLFCYATPKMPFGGKSKGSTSAAGKSSTPPARGRAAAAHDGDLQDLISLKGTLFTECNLAQGGSGELTNSRPLFGVAIRFSGSTFS